MRSQGSAAELERRRRLAVTRVLEGYSSNEVAAFFGVDKRSVNRWVKACGPKGRMKALTAKPVAGRPRKLSRQQEKVVLGWVDQSPRRFGFADELWTCRRLAVLIWQRLGVRFHSNYLATWLRARRRMAQKPATRAREQNAAAVARWVAEDWPRLQKKPGRMALTSC